MANSERRQFNLRYGPVTGRVLYGAAAVTFALSLYNGYHGKAEHMYETRPAVVRSATQMMSIDDVMSEDPVTPKQEEEGKDAWDALGYAIATGGIYVANKAQGRMRVERYVNKDWWKVWQPQFWQYMFRGLNDGK